MKIGKDIANGLLDTDVGKEFDGYTVVEKGPWEEDGKYLWMTLIFGYKGKHYSINRSRSGSEFTEWTWDHEYQDEWDCDEVRAVEKTVTTWEVVPAPTANET